jgi:hypothetical protein
LGWFVIHLQLNIEVSAGTNCLRRQMVKAKGNCFLPTLHSNIYIKQLVGIVHLKTRSRSVVARSGTKAASDNISAAS